MKLVFVSNWWFTYMCRSQIHIPQSNQCCSKATRRFWAEGGIVGWLCFGSGFGWYPAVPRVYSWHSVQELVLVGLWRLYIECWDRSRVGCVPGKLPTFCSLSGPGSVWVLYHGYDAILIVLQWSRAVTKRQLLPPWFRRTHGWNELSNPLPNF